MVIADVRPHSEAIAWLIGLLMVASLGFVILKCLRSFSSASRRAQNRAYEGVTISEKEAPGLVGVVFHAYSGFIVFVVQVEHRFWAAPDDARLVLSRLHRFNLRWGFFAYGALVIPLLSFGSYFAQRHRITKQAAQFAR